MAKKLCHNSIIQSGIRDRMTTCAHGQHIALCGKCPIEQSTPTLWSAVLKRIKQVIS